MAPWPGRELIEMILNDAAVGLGFRPLHKNALSAEKGSLVRSSIMSTTTRNPLLIPELF